MTTPTTTPADGELLPCPMCGSSAFRWVESTWNPDAEHVSCSNCPANTGPCSTKEEAAAAWNTRTTPSPAQAAVADWLPIGWYEAEPSCAGMDLRALLQGFGQMTHSGQMHWQSDRPSTTNPVWPIYATPSPGKAEAERGHHAALQRIGTALGLMPGTDLHRACVPAIQVLLKDRARLDSGVIMTSERDEFGEEYTCERRGLGLRAMIDAAMQAQERDKQ